MREILQRALSLDSSEGYADIRYEETTITSVRYSGKELVDIGSSRVVGGQARALIGGGWGAMSFNEIERAAESLERAARSARVVARHVKEPDKMAPVETVVDTVRVNPSEDPRLVDLEEKRQLIWEYNQILLGSPHIQSTDVSYLEIASRKYFANNEGTFIDQEQLLVFARIGAVARRGDLTQRRFIALGGTDDLALLRGREEEVEAVAREAGALLDAEPVEAGNYTVILDPSSAGVFVHEAFGHLSESDNLADNPRLKETMKLGRRFGGPHLNIVDDPSFSGHPGSYVYDDEGVRGRKTYLVREGILTGRLHSRQTAGKLGEEVTGNCRAKDFTHPPIVRMSNIFIEPGDASLEEMMASIDDGLLLIGAAGGQTSGEMFTFGVQLGYRIKKGKSEAMVRDIVLSGNLFTTLANISMVGEELIMNRAGGCGKKGQIIYASGSGSPYIKIDSLTIGGRK